VTPLRITYLIVFGLCVIASGFFSGSETALIGIGRERVHQLAETSRRGRRVEQLLANPDRLLSTILFANNLVNILAASIATVLFIDLVGEDWGPWISTAVVTAVILVFGEITPKSLATRFPERFSLAVATPIYRLSGVLGPVSILFIGVTRALFRVFGVKHEPHLARVTEADIRAMARLGVTGGEIESGEREIIDALFALTDRTVRELMTPRGDIVALDAPVTISALRDAISRTGHSRFPVIEGDLDRLTGLLFVKDLMSLDRDPNPDEIRRLLRAPYYIPELAPALTTLHEMRARRIALGIVLDEHGGVEGLVTVKDMMSELVGELQDEFDPGAPSAVRIGPNQWLADGRLPVEDLSDVAGVELPTGPFSTVAGLVLSLAGRIPDEGDAIDVEGLRLVVLSMDRNRIDRLRIELPG
jgi:CBS domain containing-hemolysin-like protein